MPIKRLGRYEQLILRGLQNTHTLYEVYCQIAIVYQGISKVAPSVVYTLARDLESEGLIKPLTKNPVRSRRLYALSSEGFEILKVYIELDSRVNRVFASTSVGNTEVNLIEK